jgi:hypothetical protein
MASALYIYIYIYIERERERERERETTTTMMMMKMKFASFIACKKNQHDDENEVRKFHCVYKKKKINMMMKMKFTVNMYTQFLKAICLQYKRTFKSVLIV